MCEFQFLIGSMKAKEVDAGNGYVIGFQFLIGSMKVIFIEAKRLGKL